MSPALVFLPFASLGRGKAGGGGAEERGIGPREQKMCNDKTRATKCTFSAAYGTKNRRKNIGPQQDKIVTFSGKQNKWYRGERVLW